MRESNPNQVTIVLRSMSAKDPEAAAQLLPLLYDELRRLAGSLMSDIPAGNTLQATALVHEAYLRLVPRGDPGWNNRGHFFGAAAKAMRRILVDQARSKKAVKHGGDFQRVDIEIDSLVAGYGPMDFLALDQALDELATLDDRKVDVVLLRFLTGLTVAETAAALDISESTVMGDWRFSRAFIFDRLSNCELSDEAKP